MRRLFTGNLRLKALALALAAVMWTGVAYASNPPDTRSVTVSVPQDPGALNPYTLVHPIANIVVRVSGTREHLAAFDPGDLTVSVDYHAITHIGLQDLPVSIVNNDRDVILDNAPTSVPAEIDRLGSRSVGISVAFAHLPPQGYVVANSSTSPSAVTIIGPQHRLDGINAVVNVDLSNQKTNFQADERVTLVDSSGRSVGDLGLSIPGRPQGGDVLVTIVVAPSLTSRASAVLPKVSGSPPSGHYLGGVSVSPATVVLAGPQDLLNSLDSVFTQAISLTGLTGTDSFSVKVTPPAGVTAAPTTVTVTVTIIAIPQPTPTPSAPSPSPSPSPT